MMKRICATGTTVLIFTEKSLTRRNRLTYHEQPERIYTLMFGQLLSPVNRKWEFGSIHTAQHVVLCNYHIVENRCIEGHQPSIAVSQGRILSLIHELMARIFKRRDVGECDRNISLQGQATRVNMERKIVTE